MSSRSSIPLLIFVLTACMALPPFVQVIGVAGDAQAGPAAQAIPTMPSAEPATPTPVPPTSTPEPTATPTPPAATLPLPTPDGAYRQVRVPILMYHYVSESPPGADRYRRDLSVPPQRFEEHLAYLQAQGYQGISLYDLLNHLAQGAPLPERPVVITFDDGYRDNYENAFPLLQKYGYRATVFVITEVMGQDGEPAYLTWDQARAMAAAGIDIECHARVHEDLTENDDARLIWQVLGCREMIEGQTGRRPRFVAYPSGRFEQRVADVFASDGYWGGLTTQQGSLHSSDQLFALKRLRVRSTTTVEDLAQLLQWAE